MKIFFNSKSGVVSINIFSLLILLLVSIFALTSIFYFSAKDSYKEKLSEKELLFYISELRSLLIEGVKYNSTVSIKEENVNSDIEIFLYNKTIFSRIERNDKFVTQSISTLGLTFCSNYSYVSGSGANFIYNGSCYLFST